MAYMWQREAILSVGAFVAPTGAEIVLTSTGVTVPTGSLSLRNASNAHGSHPNRYVVHRPYWPTTSKHSRMIHQKRAPGIKK